MTDLVCEYLTRLLLRRVGKHAWLPLQAFAKHVLLEDPVSVKELGQTARHCLAELRCRGQMGDKDAVREIEYVALKANEKDLQ